MSKFIYICETERDTWEVRNQASNAVLAVIIRWADCWEVREAYELRGGYCPTGEIPRLEIRDAIWRFITAETVKRGEQQRPVNAWLNLDGSEKPQAQQKEEMPVWLL